MVCDEFSSSTPPPLGTASFPGAGAEVITACNDLTSVTFPFWAHGLRVREVPADEICDAITERTALVAASAVQSRHRYSQRGPEVLRTTDQNLSMPMRVTWRDGWPHGSTVRCASGGRVFRTHDGCNPVAVFKPVARSETSPYAESAA
jgi:hypothetical protein